MEVEIPTASQDKGEGDACLLRAIEHLLACSTIPAKDTPGRETDVAAGHDAGGDNTTVEERLLSALLLCTKLESAEDRRRLLLSQCDANTTSDGPALGWFALALIRQYVQGGADADAPDDEVKAAAPGPGVSLALLRLAVRSLSLLYAEMPEETQASATVSTKAGGGPANTFHSTCKELLLEVLKGRSNGNHAIQEVDVEIAAILTLMDQKRVVGLNANNRICVAEVCMSQYRSASKSNELPSGQHGAKMEVDDNTDQNRTSQPEDTNPDEMMVQVIQSALGEIPAADGDNEDEQVGQFVRFLAHYINSLIDRDECKQGVSEELLLGLIEAAAPSSGNCTVFLPVALRAIALNAFGLVDNAEGSTCGINKKIAPAILKLLLSSLARPDNQLAIRRQIYAAIAALSDTFGLRWMANVTMAGETPTNSDLGAAAGCCTLIRLAAGELRIALGWILGADDDNNETKGDPQMSMVYMDIVKHCLSICRAALSLMVDLSEALEDEDAPLPTDFGPFAILHVRHSILDALDSSIQYLNEKPHERKTFNGNFSCIWDFCPGPVEGTVYALRMIGHLCSTFLFAYVSETDIFEDGSSGLAESAPAPGTILSAMNASLQLTSCKDMRRDETKIFGHRLHQEDDLVAPLLPGLAALLSPFVADDSHLMGSRTKAIEDPLFSDSMLSDFIADTLRRLAGSTEQAMDSKGDMNYEKITSLLASLDLCALVLDGIVSFHMKSMPFGLTEMSRQQTHLLDMLAQFIFILLEGIESFPKIIQGHADELTRHVAIQSLDRLVSCWNHVVDIGCADMESSALKKAAGYVTLAEMAIEERSEYLH